jgi:hypothetical protein
MEQFVPIKVALALVAKDEKLFLIPRRWSILGLPLPKALLPTGTSFEAQVEGIFRCEIEIAAPLIGVTDAYQGELTPAALQGDSAAGTKDQSKI